MDARIALAAILAAIVCLAVPVVMDDSSADGETCTVTFVTDSTTDGNGGYKESFERTATVGEALELPTAERTGYTLSSWLSAPGGSSLGKAGASYTPYGDTTLFASWSSNRYTIAFDGNGADSGTMEALYPCLYGWSVNLTANAFERTGYTFGGWTFDGNTYADGSAVKNLVSENGGTATLVAVWDPIHYTIEFSAGGAEGEMDPIDAVYGDQVQLPKCTFRFDGEFRGWQGTDGHWFADSAKVKDLAAEDGAIYTMTASWKCTVTFMADGGDLEKRDDITLRDTTSVVYGGSVILPQISKTGYAFGGWYTSRDYDTKAGDADEIYIPAGSLTLYAKWDPVSYTIAFDPNGAEGKVDDVKCLFGEDYTLPGADGLTYKGHSFAGWTLDGKVVKKVGDLTTTDGATVTLKASWTEDDVPAVVEPGEEKGLPVWAIAFGIVAIILGALYVYGYRSPWVLAGIVVCAAAAVALLLAGDVL